MFEHYELDISAIEKGMRISAADCERLAGLKRTDKNYSFKLMWLCKKIEKEMRLIGTPVTCRVCRNSIEVLDDPSASDYNHNEFLIGINKCVRRLQHLAEVDVRNLNTDEKKVHAKRVECDGRIIGAAIKEARKHMDFLRPVFNRFLSD